MVMAQKLRCLLSEKPGDLSLIPVSLCARREQTDSWKLYSYPLYSHNDVQPPTPASPPQHTHTIEVTETWLLLLWLYHVGSEF